MGLVLALSASAGADEVYLRGGGRISGIVVDRTDRAVVVEAGPGRVSVPLSRVERIEDGTSALQDYKARADALDPTDPTAWAQLARWAEDHDLATVARETWERVLALDPDHPEANAALGRYLVDGQWMEETEARRRLGYVRFEGRWVTPAEHEALVRERAVERSEQREDREAELRVREAEARAREAEARAREAEAGETEAPASEGGIPYDWVIYGSAVGGGYPIAPPSHGRPPHDDSGGGRPPHGGPAPPPTPEPRTPSSMGPIARPAPRTPGAVSAPHASSSTPRD